MDEGEKKMMIEFNLFSKQKGEMKSCRKMDKIKFNLKLLKSLQKCLVFWGLQIELVFLYLLDSADNPELYSKHKYLR